MALESKNKYVKVASYEGVKGEVKKVVLLYSGGLDTSVMIKWIQEEYKAEVITLTIDIGQIVDDLEAARKKALKLGAIKAYVIDAKDEFAENYIAKSIKANGMYQGRYYLATSLGRPLLAKWAVKIAAEEGADAIAHGCTGKGGDQVRLEGTALALNPDIKILAPVREWSMGRLEEIAYAKENNIPIKHTVEKPYSYDENMWGSSAEGGEIEDPTLVPPLEKILQICKLPEDAPDKPQYLKIEFIKGLPAALDTNPMRLTKIIEKANEIGANHGIGITHHVEDRVVGLKVRDIYEAPAAEIIVTAHKTLESFTSTKPENDFKTGVDQKWTDLVYGGLWYEPLIENLNAYIEAANSKVSGTVTLKLYKGSVEVVAIETPNSIYDQKLATFMTSSEFNQNASAGFIEHYSYQMKMAQRRERTALISIGKRSNKLKLLKSITQLHNMGYQLYATYKTHKFLKSEGLTAILVHKISEPHRTPNLDHLLDANRFDLIIDIPTNATDQDGKEKTDGQIIREKAVKSNTPLITTVSVAKDMVEKLSKAKV